MAERQKSDYWLTDAGQIELLRMIQDVASPPCANRAIAQARASQWDQKTGIDKAHISELDYSAARWVPPRRSGSKSSLRPTPLHATP